MTPRAPVPGSRPATLLVPAPGDGDGHWAGAPAVAAGEGDELLLAYRVRHGHDGHDETVVARWDAGGAVEPVVVLAEDRFGAAGVERPALVALPGGGWRLYVCCSTPGSPHWWVGALDAPTVEALADADHVVVFGGDDDTGVKDPVVRRTDAGWEAWVCCHLLDVLGEEDRMRTDYATSGDGLAWTLRGPALEGRQGTWDARGARLTCVLPDGRALYDGRASAAENWFERTGVARPDGPGAFRAEDGEPLADVRYVEAFPMPDGGLRLFYEARRPDLAHELRTELSPPG